MRGPHFVLTQETAISYLLRRGDLTLAELVESEVNVFDASRRNGNFLVERRAGDALLLKQARTPNASRTVASEAMIYGAFRALPASHPLRRHTVPFLEYDDDERVLLLRCVADARTLAAQQNQGRIPVRPATQLGQALGALHNLELGSSPMRDLAEQLPRRLPDAFFVHRPDHAVYCNASHGNLQAVRIMQSFPALGALIDAQRKEWRPTCLIHFDVKGDNILLGGKRRAGSSWLIDWELAALGDPAWDVGAMFADYLGVWLWSIPITGEQPPARYLSLARVPLARLQPALRRFWRSYRLARGLTGHAAAEFLLSATRFSAVRLIQRVHEQTRDLPELFANSICQLQLSWNILREPEPACVQLLRLDLIASGE
jgi:aminoglycoside phosphotransferase (APT) family kinase protein